MTSADDAREELRKNALTAFLDARVREGYRIETRTDTHAIIAARGWPLLARFRKASSRQVLSVDDHGHVTMRPAEPLRS